MTLADRPRRSEESRQRRSNAALLIQPTTNTNSYVCCGHAWQPSATPPPSYTRTSRARLARPAPAPRGYMHDLQLPQNTPRCCCRSSSRAWDITAAVTASPAACRLTGPGSSAACTYANKLTSPLPHGLAPENGRATSLCASSRTPTPLQTYEDTLPHGGNQEAPRNKRLARPTLTRTQSHNLPSAPAPSDAALPHSMPEPGLTRPRRPAPCPVRAPLSQSLRPERRPARARSAAPACARPLGALRRARPRPRPPHPPRRRHAPRACPRPHRQSRPPPRPP
jgi:hypothetical protein